ncbi:MAG: hypothetical protein JWO82_3196 [Akkermansiaceae bacterium]|nr:hypothetical protein [Akkermansiaceae bacterium]
MKVLPFLLILPVVARAADFERDLSPNRPDQTQGTTTLEPGAVQVEMGVWSYTRDKSGGVTDQTWSLGETNFVFGVTKNMDLEVLVRPYQRDSTKGLSSGDAEGFGDIDVLTRWNLWGNDGGKSSAALAPYVTIPSQTAVSTGQWEGGLVYSQAYEIADGWDLGGELGVARVWNEDTSRHEWDFLHTFEISHDLGKNGGVYLEYVGTAGRHGYEASLSAGVTWKVGDNVQLDLGGLYGLSDSADDFSITQGVTVRF